MDGCSWSPEPGTEARFCGEHGRAPALGSRLDAVAIRDRGGPLGALEIPTPSHDSSVEQDGDRARSVTLHWNRRRYVATHHQAFQFRITNVDGAPLPEVEIEVRCDGLTLTTVSKKYLRLAPARPVEPPLGFRCDQPGMYPAQVLVICRDALSNPTYLTGDLVVNVDPPHPGPPATIHQEIHVHRDAVADVTPQIGFGGMPTPPPVLDEWVPVPLFFDPVLTGIARQPEADQRGGAAAQEPIESAPVAQRAFDLLVESSGEEKRVRLHLVPELRIGRDSGANDVAVRFLPRSEANDEITRSIGREHVRLSRDGEGFVLVESGKRSEHGTWIGGSRLEQDKPVPLGDHTEFVLARDIRFRFRDYRDLASLARRRWGAEIRDSIGLRKRVQSMDAADRSKAPLLAARIRRVDAGSDGVEHVILVRRVVIGSQQGCPIRLAHDSVADWHAQLVVDGDRLFVEDLKAVGGTWVGGVRLPPGGRRSVQGETKVRFGDVEGRIVPVG